MLLLAMWGLASIIESWLLRAAALSSYCHSYSISEKLCDWLRSVVLAEDDRGKSEGPGRTTESHSVFQKRHWPLQDEDPARPALAPPVASTFCCRIGDNSSPAWTSWPRSQTKTKTSKRLLKLVTWGGSRTTGRSDLTLWSSDSRNADFFSTLRFSPLLRLMSLFNSSQLLWSPHFWTPHCPHFSHRGATEGLGQGTALERLQATIILLILDVFWSKSELGSFKLFPPEVPKVLSFKNPKTLGTYAYCFFDSTEAEWPVASGCQKKTTLAFVLAASLLKHSRFLQAWLRHRPSTPFPLYFLQIQEAAAERERERERERESSWTAELGEFLNFNGVLHWTSCLELVTCEGQWVAELEQIISTVEQWPSCNSCTSFAKSFQVQCRCPQFVLRSGPLPPWTGRKWLQLHGGSVF